MPYPTFEVLILQYLYAPSSQGIVVQGSRWPEIVDCEDKMPPKNI